MRHNNVLPNAHFRKHWQRRVKTWFDQPGRKKSRTIARKQKAAACFPRPVDLLRPSVHCQTVRYNYRLRSGRGFSLDELQACGVSKHKARSIGIAVDHRRKNRSEESFARNVERLKVYLSKLVVLPRKNVLKKSNNKNHMDMVLPTKEEVVLNVNRAIVSSAEPTVEARKILDSERNQSAFVTLRRARTDARYHDARIIRAKAEAEAAIGPKK